MKPKLNSVKFAVLTVAAMVEMSALAFANIYPATLNNGNLVLVDGGMGVGRYADRSSVVAENYAPPNYRLSISIVPVTFSEDYWRQHETCIGSPYTVGEPYRFRFRYN